MSKLNIRYLVIFLLNIFSFAVVAQETTISGKVVDSQNKGIQNVSVVLLNGNNTFLGYNFTNENGNYTITFTKSKTEPLKIELSCLGYQKVTKTINISSAIQNFTLKEKIENLKEVVVESGKKIKIEQDTTTIRVASFGNQTEQTVEDILKKLPGIEVLKDGTIKAHGKNIDKLLVEGDDLLDKNYKLLSRNLDAKVLNEVQIIENFEDNPVLKKLNDSEKVALNLKLKKGVKNVWFGNVTLGSGIVSENRWKENLNIGLLKKKIKFFYFGNYNNLGEKATDLINKNVIENNLFGSDRFEYKAKPLYSIASNEIDYFSKTQNSFNTAFLNAFTFTTKIKKKLKIRGVLYVANDKYNQNSMATTNYYVENPVSFTENNFYVNKKTETSTELEIKYTPNDKNYITNLFIVKNNPNTTANNLLFNTTAVNQKSTAKNYTFYNHFNHSLHLSENKILTNYFYIGNDKIDEKTTILSPYLNNLLGVTTTATVHQKANNKLFFVGNKSKLISKIRKIHITNSIQAEYTSERFKNEFIAENQSITAYENDTKLQLFTIFSDNALRYHFSRKVNVTANLNFRQITFKNNGITHNNFLINPSLFLTIKNTGFGNFSLSYSEKNSLPKINQLATNFQLTGYRNFLQGTRYVEPQKNQLTTLNYRYYNDMKRFSITTSLFYNNSKSTLNTSSTLTDNFNFATYFTTKGSKSYNFNFGFVKYSRKLKLASKIATANSWVNSPVSVNSLVFSNLKSYINSVTYSGTTYLKLPINFDFGLTYNYSHSIFQQIKTSNNTQEAFLNINYKIKSLLIESNNSFYFINNNNYSFNTIIVSYTPKMSKFSYRFILNNLRNENEYTYTQLDNYSFYQSTVQLVPRYILGTVTYRF